MKHLLFVIIILIPIASYSQEQKLDRFLKDIERGMQQNGSNKSQKNTHYFSNSSRGTASSNVRSKSSTPTSSTHRNERRSNVNKKEFNAFQNSSRNNGDFLVGGKNEKQHSESLWQGNSVGDVTVNRSITDQIKVVKKEINAVTKKRAGFFNAYNNQRSKIKNILKNQGYNVTEEQVSGYIETRANGKSIYSTYPKEVINEIDKAVKIDNQMEECDRELKGLQADLKTLEKECGGKCE